jgi:hypothetical protein
MRHERVLDLKKQLEQVSIQAAAWRRCEEVCLTACSPDRVARIALSLSGLSYYLVLWLTCYISPKRQ